MNILEIQKRYNTREKCIKFLEQKKWGKTPISPFTGKTNVTKRANSIYYHCNDTNKDFTVLKDTIFEASKMPLPKWFVLIGLMLTAKKGISSSQLSRTLGVTYKTAWYSAMRVRCSMVDDMELLEGIVEMDETYIGGKPKKRYVNIDPSIANLSTVSLEKPKTGRGSKNKVTVVGMVERGGGKRVVTKVMNSLTSRDMIAMLKKYVATDKTIMMTDEFKSYKPFDEYVQHLSVNHSKQYVKDGIIHTNTIEGFWSIIKNGIRGQYHVLSKKYLPFYLVEFSYKYNNRSNKNTFNETIEKAVEEDKCTVSYKPKKNVKRIVYKPKRKTIAKKMVKK
ncbi:MAG: IS1595 family transposase [Flavobacteriales bacterium]